MNATLLARLDAVGKSLADSGHAVALIALGSAGLETERLDAWSDLDFFAIVEQGHKASYIERLDWLASACPLVWHYRNTADGHKALMADGVLCEFAVFEPRELDTIAFATGRAVWKRAGVDDAIAVPRKALASLPRPDETWIVGEVLSCLFVGLQRWHRGEKLSAARLVQGHAVDRLIELDALRHPPAPGDPFNRERRVETRQPLLAAELRSLMPGYDATPTAALAMLDALGRRGAIINAAMNAAIRRLTEG